MTFQIMQIGQIIQYLELLAPPSLQESYDNSGLLTGNAGWPCTGILVSLDATEEVILEAVEKKCNLVISHHPILFRSLKRITGNNYVEKALITAIKNDVSIYALHTNLDNVLSGVSGKMGQVLGLQQMQILAQKEDTLKKLFTFVPVEQAEKVREAIFEAGGGWIAKYSHCSFTVPGEGTFKPGPGTNPFIGEEGKVTRTTEVRIEIIFPAHLQSKVIKALLQAHPYEEVAFDVVPLSNSHPYYGSGIIGELPAPMDEAGFLQLLKQKFNLKVIRHTPFLKRQLRKVAMCGGAGSFLISNALAAGADIYVTGDVKYHEFFEANGRIVVADIGHYESEQFTIELLQDIIVEKFPNFAVLKSGIQTNPVNYYL